MAAAAAIASSCWWTGSAALNPGSYFDGHGLILIHTSTVDSGAELHSMYSSDITRVWPLHRCARFTEPQRRLYEAVLHVQQSLIAQCRPGLSIRDLYTRMNDLLAHVLLQIGLVSVRDAGDKQLLQQVSLRTVLLYVHVYCINGARAVVPRTS